MKYTINELANSKGITPLVREALLQMEAELDATNRQVEILSDALAESRREVAVKDEALKLALEALLTAHAQTCSVGRLKDWQQLSDAITAIKQALAAPVQEPVGWTEVTDLDSLTVGDHIRVKKGGVLVAEIGFYSGSHDFEVTSSVSERLLIGEGLNKERIGQAVKKNHVCAPAKGWKVEVATPPAQPAPVQEPVNQRAYEMALRQWESWKQYALELQEKLVKYEGGAPMVLNTTPPAAQQPDVDAMIAIARADEREACAKLIEAETGMNPDWQKHLADAIRARKDK